MIYRPPNVDFYSLLVYSDEIGLFLVAFVSGWLYRQSFLLLFYFLQQKKLFITQDHAKGRNDSLFIVIVTLNLQYLKDI